MVEKRIPVRESFTDELEYLEAVLDAEIEYRDAMFRQIDRATLPAIRTEQPKSGVPTRTVHDYLADHPALLKRYKEIGVAALLEL